MSALIGVALIIIAIIIFIIIAIWYAITQPAQTNQTIWFILATALALLIIGVILSSWSLMTRGLVYNHEGKPGIKGVHSPLF